MLAAMQRLLRGLRTWRPCHCCRAIRRDRRLGCCLLRDKVRRRQHRGSRGDRGGSKRRRCRGCGCTPLDRRHRNLLANSGRATHRHDRRQPRVRVWRLRGHAGRRRQPRGSHGLGHGGHGRADTLLREVADLETAVVGQVLQLRVHPRYCRHHLLCVALQMRQESLNLTRLGRRIDAHAGTDDAHALRDALAARELVRGGRQQDREAAGAGGPALGVDALEAEDTVHHLPARRPFLPHRAVDRHDGAPKSRGDLAGLRHLDARA
mmetsp:Transcript_39302/g.101925  ORF Transcript_39302/g.101925 Transcript_39302/m.101925 type:complete len:264 (-) Transcript_39302:157-948(-)